MVKLLDIFIQFWYILCISAIIIGVISDKILIKIHHKNKLGGKHGV